jgi:hypothetical protein
LPIGRRRLIVVIRRHRRRSSSDGEENDDGRGAIIWGGGGSREDDDYDDDEEEDGGAIRREEFAGRVCHYHYHDDDAVCRMGNFRRGKLPRRVPRAPTPYFDIAPTSRREGGMKSSGEGVGDAPSHFFRRIMTDGFGRSRRRFVDRRGSLPSSRWGRWGGGSIGWGRGGDYIWVRMERTKWDGGEGRGWRGMERICSAHRKTRGGNEGRINTSDDECDPTSTSSWGIRIAGGASDNRARRPYYLHPWSYRGEGWDTLMTTSDATSSSEVEEDESDRDGRLVGRPRATTSSTIVPLLQLAIDGPPR